MTLRIGNLIVKELIQFSRDRLLTMFILLAPALQLILMARSVDRGVRQQPVAVLDLDHSRLSRQIVVAMDNTEELQIQFYAESLDEVQELLDRGKARLAVVIPAGFAEELARPYRPNGGAGTPQQIQVISDATNTVAASITMAAAVGAVNRLASAEAAGQGLALSPPIDLKTSIQFNPTMDVRDYTIPAQLGFLTYQITLAVAALGLARERELGTLEQLLVTPYRRSELVLGKGIPAVAIGMVNFGVMLVVGLVVFDVPMNGSPLLLVGLTVLFVVAVVSWGLVISAVSRTQQQAILFVFIQAMVDMTLSGFIVATKNMPAFLQAMSRVVPLQYYLDIVRSVMIKGAGWEEMWPRAAALGVLSVVMGGIAFLSVARRLE